MYVPKPFHRQKINGNFLLARRREDRFKRDFHLNSLASLTDLREETTQIGFKFVLKVFEVTEIDQLTRFD